MNRHRGQFSPAVATLRLAQSERSKEQPCPLAGVEPLIVRALYIDFSLDGGPEHCQGSGHGPKSSSLGVPLKPGLSPHALE